MYFLQREKEPIEIICLVVSLTSVMLVEKFRISFSSTITPIKHRSLQFHRRELSRSMGKWYFLIRFSLELDARKKSWLSRDSRRACTRIGLCPPMVYHHVDGSCNAPHERTGAACIRSARINWPKLSAPRFLTSAISHRSALQPHPCIQPGEAQRIKRYVELCGSRNKEKTHASREREREKEGIFLTSRQSLPEIRIVRREYPSNLRCCISLNTRVARLYLEEVEMLVFVRRKSKECKDMVRDVL